ncbi:MAG TPA: biopolymer transporter ExbD [Myxococcota bacterium]|nr:biopolymer transporter ExbD [Myxococcota bacterium]
MARRRGERLNEKFPEPDLLPILNIIFMLILALVSMAALLRLGVLSSEAQKISKGIPVPKEEEAKKPLNLVVFITDAGFNFSIRGEAKMGHAEQGNPSRKLPLIPKTRLPDGRLGYDYAALQLKLSEYKALDPSEENMTITADPDVIFDAVIQTMDAARFKKDKTILFPKITFAAGLVG